MCFLCISWFNPHKPPLSDIITSKTEAQGAWLAHCHMGGKRLPSASSCGNSDSPFEKPSLTFIVWGRWPSYRCPVLGTFSTTHITLHYNGLFISVSGSKLKGSLKTRLSLQYPSVPIIVPGLYVLEECWVRMRARHSTLPLNNTARNFNWTKFLAKWKRLHMSYFEAPAVSSPWH